jgi:hypothetical protein
MYTYQRLSALIAEPNRLESRLYLANVTMPCGMVQEEQCLNVG